MTTEISSSRLESLTDGVFAVAMTILVLSIEVPPQHELMSMGVDGFLATIFPKLLMFVICFFIIGTFWADHHHSFHYIDKIDRFIVWLNILWLMSICLIPFTVTLISEVGYSIHAEIIFGVNIFFIAFLQYAIFWYALKKGFLDDESMHNTRGLRRSSTIIITIIILAILCSFIFPTFSRIIYFLIPILSLFSIKSILD